MAPEVRHHKNPFRVSNRLRTAHPASSTCRPEHTITEKGARSDTTILCRLCDSVAQNLIGQRLESFTRISSAVRKSVEEALTRILTPRRSIDIMREIHAAKAKGKPYTIVFVGVNGVGKSTNLSKVAYWLLQNDMKVAGLSNFLDAKEDLVLARNLKPSTKRSIESSSTTSEYFVGFILSCNEALQLLLHAVGKTLIIHIVEASHYFVPYKACIGRDSA